MAAVVHQTVEPVEVEDIHRSYPVQVCIDLQEAFAVGLARKEADNAHQRWEDVLI
jgi:hypothetical protein